MGLQSTNKKYHADEYHGELKNNALKSLCIRPMGKTKVIGNLLLSSFGQSPETIFMAVKGTQILSLVRHFPEQYVQSLMRNCPKEIINEGKRQHRTFIHY